MPSYAENPSVGLEARINSIDYDTQSNTVLWSLPLKALPCTIPYRMYLRLAAKRLDLFSPPSPITTQR
jgi:hypothetical protein